MSTAHMFDLQQIGCSYHHKKGMSSNAPFIPRFKPWAFSRQISVKNRLADIPRARCIFHNIGVRYLMGEEKPEEELMGKRKSSPRFDNIITTLSSIRIAGLPFFIHPAIILF
jgi:hypothetical protein